MIHRKRCGCVLEIKYEVGVTGLKTTVKKIKKCRNCEENTKLESIFNKEHNRRKNEKSIKRQT
jgi:hypothetical protein